MQLTALFCTATQVLWGQALLLYNLKKEMGKSSYHTMIQHKILM